MRILIKSNCGTPGGSWHEGQVVSELEMSKETMYTLISLGRAVKHEEPDQEKAQAIQEKPAVKTSVAKKRIAKKKTTKKRGKR
jgi:hypothetical protein